MFCGFEGFIWCGAVSQWMWCNVDVVWGGCGLVCCGCVMKMVVVVSELFKWLKHMSGCDF